MSESNVFIQKPGMERHGQRGSDKEYPRPHGRNAGVYICYIIVIIVDTIILIQNIDLLLICLENLDFIKVGFIYSTVGTLIETWT